MSDYFISIQTEDNKFVGVVYNKANNNLLYKTQKHSVQRDAQDEATMYLKTMKSVSVPIPTTQTANPRRCCGR